MQTIHTVVRRKGLRGSSDPHKYELIAKALAEMGIYKGNSNGNGKKSGGSSKRTFGETKAAIDRNVHGFAKYTLAQLSGSGKIYRPSDIAEQIRFQKTLNASDEELNPSNNGLYKSTTARPFINKHVTFEEHDVLSEEVFGSQGFHVITDGHISLSHGDTVSNYLRE